MWKQGLQGRGKGALSQGTATGPQAKLTLYSQMESLLQATLGLSASPMAEVTLFGF